MQGQSNDGADQYLNFYCTSGAASGVVKDCGANSLKDDAAKQGTRTAFKGNY